MNAQTIAELLTYKGTVLERAADEIIKYGKDIQVADNVLLNAFEELENFSERFTQSTGMLLTHSSGRLEPINISLGLVGANGFGVIGVTSDYIQQEGYNKGYLYIVNYLIDFIRMRMKEEMSKKNFNFNSYINNVAINYISDEAIEDRQKAVSFLFSKLLPTYQRNKNRI